MMITYGFHSLQLRLSPEDQHLGSYKTKFFVLNAHALHDYRKIIEILIHYILNTYVIKY